ncbi:hypothetical protein OVY01_22830, partial [Robbsia sp. Bb-Pol-6]|nr:hypothetical protein [Robbsia betulipollinis]
SHGMNPNVLRRWIKEIDSAKALPQVLEQRAVDVQSAFVTLPIPVAIPQIRAAEPADVRIEIQRKGAVVSIMWPAARLSESAAWVRELTR